MQAPQIDEDAVTTPVDIRVSHMIPEYEIPTQPCTSVKSTNPHNRHFEHWQRAFVLAAVMNFVVLITGSVIYWTLLKIK